MADPLDDVLGETPAVATAPAPAAAPSDAELALEAERQRNEQLQQQLTQTGQLLNDVRAQMAATAAHNAASITAAPATDEDDFDWSNPRASTTRIVQEQINQSVAPQARGINTTLGNIVVENFIQSKATDRLYAFVLPIFRKSLEQVPKDQLGGMPDNVRNQVLETAWKAAKGEYVDIEQEKRARSAPPNIGGGGSGGGGPVVKKTLAEVDPQAYNMAMRSGLTAEQMQAIADELQEG